MNEAESGSLFELLTERLAGRITPIVSAKAALVEISHLLEDLLVSEQLPAVVFTGFQEARYWQTEAPRYRAIFRLARQVAIFAGGNLQTEEDPRAIHVRLHGPDPLREEWFLLVLTERFAALLAARDLRADAEHEDDRPFSTFWTFEPDVIDAALGLLRGVIARERPDRLACLDSALRQLRPPAPDARLVTLFTTRLMDCLVRQQQQRLRLERTIAHESRLRMLGQVLSGVAHELNNPLQSMLGFATLLLDDPYQSASAREDVQHIIDAAERARKVVRNLLQLARQSNDERMVIDLGDLLRQTLAFVRSDLDSARVTLQIDLAPKLPLVNVNPVRIQQLLINLISNATQALEEVDLPRTIRIEIAPAQSGWVYLTVSDNGPGIAPALRRRVFEPFFTTKPAGKGTGLGLSIVRAIVQEHQGQIQLDSQPGQGSRFQIRLPVVAGAAPAVRPPDPAEGQGHILLIDDDVQITLLVRRILERAGYTVDACPSTLQSLDLLDGRHYDAIISDVLMPDMDGIEFYQELTVRHPAMCDRLIFITGDASRLATSLFLQTTGVPFLLKPFGSAELLLALSKLLPSERLALNGSGS
jgi:signal transduction histidine kinase/ActR/RegA family two-component response regulator